MIASKPALSLAALLLALVRSLPVTEQPHECSLLSIVATNLDAADASAILAIYADETASGPKARELSERLARERGGFWDVFFMGRDFSYSVHCIEFVTLASAEWHAMLCKEAIDADAEDCGDRPLVRDENGTLSARAAPQPAAAPSAHPIIRDQYGEERAILVARHRVIRDQYDSWLDDRHGADAPHATAIAQLVEAMPSETLLSTRAAAALREAVEGLWPRRLWNVLLQRQPGNHYYFAEEQLNLMVDDLGLSVAVFDRQCATIAALKARSSKRLS